MRSSLQLRPCSHAAADFAVRRWHYSRCLPAGKMVRYGVHEDGNFVGVVIFSRGASVPMFKSWGVQQSEMAELTRVALGDHRTHTTRIISIAIRLLRKACPGLHLLISFADSMQGHHGGIYQAGNWVFCGSTAPQKRAISAFGRPIHERTIAAAGKKKSQDDNAAIARRITLQPKHRYAYPLSGRGAELIAARACNHLRPRRAGSIDGDALGIQPSEGGSTPTSALHSSEENRRSSFR